MLYMKTKKEIKRNVKKYTNKDIIGPLSIQNFIHPYMWQSRVEIEHHSVAYFDRIAAFEAL